MTFAVQKIYLSQLRYAVFLRLLQIGKQTAQRFNDQRAFPEPDSRQRAYAELALYQSLRLLSVEVSVRQDGQISIGQIRYVSVKFSVPKVFVGDEFSHIDADQFVEQISPDISGREFSGHQLAGGYVAVSQSRSILRSIDTGQIIILLFIQHSLIHCGSRRDDPDNFALYDSFCRGGIFRLLAHGDFIALFDEFCDICVRSVVRNAAHRSFFFHTAVFSGQGNLHRL